MNTTKSLPVLVVALIATLTTATAFPADDTIPLSGHEARPELEADSVPIHVARDCSNGGARRSGRIGRRTRDADGYGAALCGDGMCADGHRVLGDRGHNLGAHAANAHSRGLRVEAHGAAAGGHSGQPLIDPWARADWIAQQRAARQSWHAGYYHTAWGGPVALMVAPTARMQTRWGWGVAQSTLSPIYPQFKRPYPAAAGAGMGGGMVAGTNPLLPTPRWPSHTDQFGVYYVRGPW